MLGQVGVRPRRLRDDLLDPVSQLLQRRARVASQPEAGYALSRHRRPPVPTLDHSNVQVQWMGVRGEGRGWIGVQLRLQLAERPDDVVAGLDCVGTLAGIGDMHGVAGDGDVEPQHPDLGGREGGAERLDHDAGVGRVAGGHAGQSAVAAALLLDHRLQRQPACRLDPDPAQRGRSHHRRDQPRLHVARAAPVHPVAVDGGAERRRAPQAVGLGADHVDVAVEDQRSAASVTAEPGDHVALAGDVPREGCGVGVGAQLRGIHRHVDRLQSQLAVGLCHHRLAGLLVAQHRGLLDQSAEQVDARVRLGRDGG